MKNLTLALVVMCFSYAAIAQNVGINTTTPNPQAALDVESTDKGVLIPRLTTAQRTTLGATLGIVDESLLVYDKDETQFYFWDGAAWSTIQDDADSDPTNEIELPITASPGQVPTWDGSAWVAQDGGSGSSNTANTSPIVGYSGVKIVKLVEAQCQNDIVGTAYIGADDNIWSHGWGDDYAYGMPGRTTNALRPVVQVIDRSKGEKRGKWTHVFTTRTTLWAITDDGEVFRRGSPVFGQLGNASTTESLIYLTKMAFFETNNIKVKYLYVAPTANWPSQTEGSAVFALTYDGDVYCWGRNTVGQLGIGNTTDQLTPVKITGLDFQFIHKMTQSGGPGNGVSVAALDTLNSIYTWGYNGFGQLGLGNTTNYSAPALVTGVTATDIVTRRFGAGSIVIVTPNGEVMGTGRNHWGQLADGTLTDKQVFTPTATLLTNAKSVHFDAAGISTAVVTEDGFLYVAGFNQEHGLGIGNSSPAMITDLIMPVAPFQGMVKKAVFQGYAHDGSIHVLDSLGRIWACGENRSGQLGTGFTHNVDPDGLFVQVMDELNGTVKFVDVQPAGHYRYDYFFTIALTEDGRVMTTGAPQFGQTGQGDDNYFRHYYELIKFD